MKKRKKTAEKKELGIKQTIGNKQCDKQKLIDGYAMYCNIAPR